MATLLTRTVKRELRSTDRKGRALIVSIEPGDILTFRPKGAKRSVSCYAGFAFQLCQLLTVSREYEDRMKKYKADKAIGIRRRKPSKPFLPFSKVYLDATK